MKWYEFRYEEDKRSWEQFVKDYKARRWWFVLGVFLSLFLLWRVLSYLRGGMYWIVKAGAWNVVILLMVSVALLVVSGYGLRIYGFCPLMHKNDF